MNRLHFAAPIAICFALMVAMTQEAAAGEPQLAHMVYFTLNQDTDAAKKKLVAACKKHLSGHEGTVYFSAGVIVKELQREVNDRNFHVALHMVFRDKAAHDKYQTHPRHLKFIQENKDSWSGVRVFDSYVSVD